MEFSSMIIKNIKYNIKNYTAYLLGNSLIQCILFMFFTLVFSEEFMKVDETTPLKANFISVVMIMIAFSIAFIIFTTVSFTKYRGKEFGVYFTIGLTSKEIIKILCYENIIISFCSFIFAAVGGSVFSRLFHMAIWKILKIDNINISLSFKAYLAIFAISIWIFIFTTLYQAMFLKRYSVINILKSKSKKDIGGTSTVLGLIGIVMFIASIITFKISINGNVKASFNLFGLSIFCAIISIYLLIGFSMTVVVKVLKRFKGTYNNNILFINSLSHRFMSYRTVLYVVTLMVAGAMTFISMAYGMYKATERQMDVKYPHDVSFIVDKRNKDNKDIKKIATKNLGEVENYIELEGLNIPDIRVDEDRCLWRNFQILVISEENYIALGKERIDLNKGQIVYSHLEKMGSYIDAGFMLDLSKESMREMEESLDSYKETHKENEYIYVPGENKIDKIDSAISNFYSKDYSRGNFLVVNNEDYKAMKERLGEEKITYDIFIDLKDNTGFDNIKNTLQNDLGNKVSNTLLIKEHIFDEAIKENGFMLFIFSFMGMMFLIGSSAVLYFKTITSIEEDRERANQLVKLGLTKKEIEKLSMKELGAIFIVPPVIAIICVGYFLSNLLNLISDGDYMWQNSLVVFLVYSIIQIIFYLLTSTKYKKQINKR